MRGLGLLLVLANLGFLGWHLWIAAPEPRPTAAQPHTTVPRLLLVSELEQSQAASRLTMPFPGDAPDELGSDEVAIAEALEDAQHARCVSLGPFLDLTEAAEAAAALRQRAFQPSQRLAESRIWVGHWVYLPPFPDRDEAREAVRTLRDRGITDLYIEPAGELENAVSLGLFTDRVRAETRAGDVRRLGFTPEIRDRDRLGSVYWVDFELGPEVQFSLADYQGRPNRIVRLERRKCPEEDSTDLATLVEEADADADAVAPVVESSPPEAEANAQ